MKKYVWEVVEDDGAFIVHKPSKAPTSYRSSSGANRGMMRSYRATRAKWKRHRWTVENECITDNRITVYAEEPERTTRQFIVHLGADQHARAMEKSALTGVTLSKMIRDALEIVLAE